MLFYIEKTAVFYFGTKHTRTEKPNSIRISDLQVTLTNDSKFLGVYINEFLDWTLTINNLLKKLNSICVSSRILVNYMDKNTLKILYYDNLESVLTHVINSGEEIQM